METLNKSITGTEVLYYFLRVARIECINSVDVQDLNNKMELLLQLPEFSSIKPAFYIGDKFSMLYAIQSLIETEAVTKYQNELMLSMPIDEGVHELPQKTKLMYLNMARLYRTIGNTKECIQKGND